MRVVVLKEVRVKTDRADEEICYQKVIYAVDVADEEPVYGYRFMRRYKGAQKPDRGQARIPTSKIALKLIRMMERREK